MFIFETRIFLKEYFNLNSQTDSFLFLNKHFGMRFYKLIKKYLDN